MSKSQNIIGYAKKVHFQDANVNLPAPEKSHVVQIELEKLGQIPYGTIHLGRDQKIKQDVETCQSIEWQGIRLQSQQQILGDAPSCKVSTATSDLPFSETGQQNQPSSSVKKLVGPQKTSNILTAFGLSSKDLDEVESYPSDKLTLDSLPKILKQIKKKRASLKHIKGDSSPQQSQSNRIPRDDGIGEKKSTERSSESQDTVCKPLVNYGYDLSSGESSAGSEQEGKSGEAFHKKERHFSESPHHVSKFDSDSESEIDYEVVEELPFPCAEEQSVLEKKRRTPILQNIKDFLGYLPVVLPHCCSLCDKTIDTLQDWNQHMNDPLHKLRCLLLQRVYPDWVPGELPVAKKNLVEKDKVTTVVLKKKVKMKSNADIPMPSKRESLKDPHSRIVVLGNLPSSGFSDFDTVRLGSTFGRVLKYLKVGEKAFLKMDSEMACNNIIEHFKKKPLFYGRLLSAEISSAQIQPLLKKPSAKIEEMLNKVNQADMSTRECFLGPILKDKPDNLKKHLTSERERKSSESSEREESKSSDESNEAAEWKSTGGNETMQPRNRERVHGLSHEIMERQRRMRRLQRGDPERLMWRDSFERDEPWDGCERERRTSHERGQQRGSVEREEQRSSSERGDHGDSGEIGEWRACSERRERRDSSESGVQGGSSERAMWVRGSERVEGAWGVSNERGAWGVSSERGEWGGSSERGEWKSGGEWGGSSERREWRGGSERGEWRSDSEWGEWGDSSEKGEWGGSSERGEWGGSSERGEWRSGSERGEWGSGSERGEGERSESREREWENDDAIESAEWEHYKSCISKDIKDPELNNDVEMKSEKVREETPIPFLESDTELEDLMEKYESDDDEAELEDTQYEAKEAIETTENQAVAEMDLQEPISLKNKTEEPGRVVYVGHLVPGRCKNGDLIHLAELFGKISNILLIKRKGEGFVEMYNSADAQAMVRFYKAKPPVIRGKVIRVELCQKYKKLHLKFPGMKPAGDSMSSFGVPQRRQFGAPQDMPEPEEDILAPTSTPTLAELRAKYSTQLLRWANVPLEDNMPTKDKRWNPQTYEGKELDCFRFLPYAFKVSMLDTHEQYLRSITGTPDMYELDTPKIDDAFIQLLVGEKVVSSRDDLDKKLGEPERVLCKAQSKVAEIVGPLMLAIQKYELDELSGELDSLTTEQLIERLQSTIISCHQSIVCAGQTHRWLTGLRTENLLQLFKFGKTSIKPQDYPNLTSSDLLGAELVEQIQKKGEVLKRVTTIPPLKKKTPINVFKKKKVFQKQQRWQQPYYRNPKPFRGRGRSFRGHPRGHPIF
ncbi:uncharacterized protein LOC127569204 [Pristis pectinata]|uniref:uncharacterized protein LOC127569204 n=1 Tax=Pristis pectinata TaxID=685728 RepID=UPI00223DE92D|nr:uncharacterized protein LOC127569204 [Pristis pectinata]